ncbi:MAG: bacillithiol biosynthesis cysteine-adding enzyme BshC [Aureispira sp.]
MEITRLDYAAVAEFSTLDKAYAAAEPTLRPFYEHPVNLEQFEAVIAAKQGFDRNKRTLLATELLAQYQAVEASEATLNNIKALRQDNCYTIITAHQPSLFTGPLYTMYKILSAIKLAELVQQTYPAVQVVPVFWMGGEDHDFEEVNHLHLFGNTLTWDDEQGGSVGAYDTGSMRAVLDQTKEILGNGVDAQLLAEKLEAYFGTARTYREGVRDLLNWLFADYGLVIANAGTKAFKQQLIPVLQEELLQHSSKALVEQTVQELEAAGFGQQAHARSINVFYLSPQKRSRIVLEEGQYQVLDTDISFSKAELLQHLEEQPEQFSPNVILRPLFQELVFPNLAYVGGGGELAYWLERKKQFEHYQIPFPMLVRRASVLWIPKGISKLMDKLELGISDIFTDTHQLIKQYVIDNASEELSFAQELEALNQVFEQLLTKTIAVDPALEKAVIAQQVNTQKAIGKLEQRLIRAEKQKQESSIQQIEKIKDTLFPNQGLQERYDNFMGFYTRYGNEFINTLYQEIEPLDKQLLVVKHNL